jgi:hypothetical protein
MLAGGSSVGVIACSVSRLDIHNKLAQHPADFGPLLLQSLSISGWDAAAAPGVMQALAGLTKLHLQDEDRYSGAFRLPCFPDLAGWLESLPRLEQLALGRSLAADMHHESPLYPRFLDALRRKRWTGFVDAGLCSMHRFGPASCPLVL